MVKVRKDLTGMVFGRLTVIRQGEDLNTSEKYPRAGWLVKCSCGSEPFLTQGHYLKSGDTKSCGCLKRDVLVEIKTKHGKARTREYKIWAGIIKRCTNPKAHSYPLYGGRGISMCDRWRESFENFLEDMGPCPSGYSIDRIDVNGNYEPSNCRWTDSTEQAYNINIRANNASGRTGVSLDRSGKWIARISYRKHEYFLGYFSSFEDAVKAREEAEIKYYGYNKK